MEDEGDSCRLSASGQPKEPMWPIIVFHEGFENVNSLAVEFHTWFLSNV